jgi:actin-related protein
MQSSKEDRERIAEIMFEKFKAPSVYIGLPEVFGLYGFRRKTGLAIHSGYGMTNIVPVYQGTSLNHCSISMMIGGCYLDLWFRKMLWEKGEVIEDADTICKVKENVCYVADDFGFEMMKAQTGNDVDFLYPIGSSYKLRVVSERFRCPEILFQPHLNDFIFDGIDVNAFESVEMCVPEIQSIMYKNVVLLGGNMMFRGMQNRIEKGLRKLAPADTEIIVSNPGDGSAVWAGMSVLGSMSVFADMAFVKEEYAEYGKSFVHWKCI